MRWISVQQLGSEKFRRLTGVKKNVYTQKPGSGR